MGSAVNRATFGFTLSHQDFYNTETDVDLGMSNAYRPAALPPLLARPNPIKNVEVITDQWGGFLADDLTLFQRVHALVALRRSGIDEKIRFPRRDDPSWQKSDNAAWTPTFGLVYDITPAMSVYASYAKGLERGGIAPTGTLNAWRSLRAVALRAI